MKSTVQYSKQLNFNPFLVKLYHIDRLFSIFIVGEMNNSLKDTFYSQLSMIVRFVI